MKKALIPLLLFFIFCEFSTAQNKLFTLEEAVLKQRALAPKSLTQLSWIPNSTNYVYVENGVLTITNAATEKVIGKVALVDINKELAKLKSVDTLPNFFGIDWDNSNVLIAKTNNQQFYYDLTANKIIEQRSNLFTDATENTDEEPTQKSKAYTLKNNLFVQANSKITQVTKDENENIVNGKSVHREEFGIFKGTFWSPKGTFLAFYRMDQTMVKDYPIVNFAANPAENVNIKYPMAGGTSHEVTVGVYDVKKDKTIFLETGSPKDQYLTNVAWSKDETKVYIAILNRDQNRMMLNSYNASTGKFIQTLFEEKGEKYVQPLHPLEFINDNHFIWQSERDGHNHIYLYDISGKLIKQVTKGNWEVLAVNGFDAKGQQIYFSASTESPINKDVYKVDLKSGKVARITSGEGTHNVVFNYNKEYLIDYFSSTTVPREIAIVNTVKPAKKIIFKAENPLKEYKTGKLNVFTIKTENNIDLFCRMVKPVDFDSTKKYPVIVYLYNGPGVRLIYNTWQAGGDLWYQYMAQKGFIVFTVDGRGSEDRGVAFEQATFKQLGNIEMVDQLKGVEYLKSLPYVDANRMGVHGWSYGGFMTTSLMTRHPGVFKVGVAGGPVIDWSYYEIMYTERFMDTPQTNKKGYDESNLLNYADKLKGKLLMIHGTNDDVVVWQHSLMFIKKCVDKNVPIDYFAYPGHLHNVTGKDRLHLMTKITDYFITNL